MDSDSPIVGKTEEALEKKLAQMKVKRSEEEYSALAQKYNLPFSLLKSTPVDGDALSILDEAAARAAELAIIFKAQHKLTVAVLDPENSETKKILDDLRKQGNELDLIMTSPKSLAKIWERYSTIHKSSTYDTGAIEIQEAELDKLYNEITS